MATLRRRPSHVSGIAICALLTTVACSPTDSSGTLDPSIMPSSTSVTGSATPSCLPLPAPVVSVTGIKDQDAVDITQTISGTVLNIPADLRLPTGTTPYVHIRHLVRN
jgi:hypothetical protein